MRDKNSHAAHRIRRVVKETLKSKSPARLNSLVDLIYARMDMLVAEWRALVNPRIACQKGCSFCCYVQVHPTAPEVLRIAAYLRDTQTDEELAITRARIAELKESTDYLSMKEVAETRYPCAMLVDGKCSIYPVRPLICRGWNSSDVAACEAVYNKERGAHVPFDKGQVAALQAVRDDGLCEGIKSARLSDEFLRLPQALTIALELPDAAARWLRGEDVFAAARFDNNDVMALTC